MMILRKEIKMENFEHILVNTGRVPEGTTFEWYSGWDETFDGRSETRDGEAHFPDGSIHHIRAERGCFDSHSDTAWLVD